MPIIENPLRVPIPGTGKWLYLRCWLDMPRHSERTWATGVLQIVATERQASVNMRWLPRHMMSCGSVDEGKGAIDEWLLSLGAEEVPEGEWPDGSVGETPRGDRQPFTSKDFETAVLHQRSLPSV